MLLATVLLTFSSGSLRCQAGSSFGTPHVGGLVATGVTHRKADQRRSHALRGVHQTGERADLDELRGVVVRQVQRRGTGHRQTDRRAAGALHTFGGQECRQLAGEEGLPLVGLAACLAASRLVPVGVPAGLATDRHHERQTGLQVPLEGGGVDVPAVEVVLRTKTVEQIHGGRVGATALELDLDVTTHGCRRHLQVLDGQTRPGERASVRGLAHDADQARQQRRCGGP